VSQCLRFESIERSELSRFITIHLSLLFRQRQVLQERAYVRRPGHWDHATPLLFLAPVHNKVPPQHQPSVPVDRPRMPWGSARGGRRWAGPQGSASGGIAIGDRGVLLTTDPYRERTASLQLSDWLKEVHESLSANSTSSESVTGKRSHPESASDGLAAELSSLRNESRPFQLASTGVSSCAFLRQTASGSPGPCDVVLSALRHVRSTRQPQCKNCVRVLPVEATCSPSPDAISESCKPLVASHFSGVRLSSASEGTEEAANDQDEPRANSDDKHKCKDGIKTDQNSRAASDSTIKKTFAVRYNKRGSQSAPSHAPINEAVAKLVPQPPHSVDLNNPDLTIVVEVVKNVACIAIVPEYVSLSKFNLRELAAPSDEKEEQQKEGANAKAKAEAEVSSEKEGGDDNNAGGNRSGGSGKDASGEDKPANAGEWNGN